MGHHDENLIDKVKNVFGMGDDRQEDATRMDIDADERADGWAGVPEALYDDTSGTIAGDPDLDGDAESGLGRNPGPIGSARYEDGAAPDAFGGTDLDADGDVDPTREDVAAGEFGGAYGEDDTPMPTRAAWDRGEAPPGEATFGADDEFEDRRELGI